MTTTVGYDPRLGGTDMATTREKEIKRNEWRSGLVKRAEDRKKDKPKK